MNTGAWVAVGAAVWLAGSVALALLLGRAARVLRRR